MLLIEEVDLDSTINEVLVEKKTHVKKYIIRGPFIEANIENKNKRIYPYPIVAPQMEAYQEIIKNHRSVGELNHPQCHSESAKILTEDGWKYFKDISNKEKVYSLDISSKEIELHSIKRKIEEFYNGKMIRFKGRNINTLVTPNHKMLVIHRNGEKDYITAEEIKNNISKYNHSYISRTCDIFEGEYVKEFNFGVYDIKNRHPKATNLMKEKYDKDLVIDAKLFIGFLGLYLAEGSCQEPSTINIYQRKPKTTKKIRELFNQFPSTIKWQERITKDGTSIFHFSDFRIYDILKPLGICYDKYIPKKYKNLSIPLLSELLDWFILGDGRKRSDNGYNSTDLFSTSEKLIDDLHEILIKIGGCGNRKTEYPEKDYYFASRLIEAKNKKPLHFLNIASTKNIWLDNRFINITEENYNSKVYCVEVKNNNFYVMDNGKSFWSGNSLEINPKNISHKITKMEWEGKNIVMGEAIIASTPNGMIVRALMDSGIKLAVSSRGSGTLKEGVVQKDYRYICNDIVWDPSASKAFVDNILEHKTEWILENGLLVEQEIESLKDKLKNFSHKDINKVIIEVFREALNKITLK